jgi:hypothetical protein
MEIIFTVSIKLLERELTSRREVSAIELFRKGKGCSRTLACSRACCRSSAR